MINFDVTNEIDKLAQQISVFHAKQLPFITAQALNAVAQDAAAEIVRQMPSRFVLRRNWITKGVRVTFANKVLLRAVISDKDQFMNKQEDGGTQVNLRGKRFLAVPMPDARGGGKGSVLARYQLKNLPRINGQVHGPRSKAFPINIPFYIDAHDGRHYIAIRDAKGKTKSRDHKDTGIKLIWRLTPETHYKERFEFAPTVARVVKDRLPRQFQIAMDRALASAK
jgi:glucose/arabinose dehydrogenase